MNHTDRIALGIVRAEGVGADKLCEAVGLVGVRAAHRAHFMENDGDAARGDLPGGFGTGEATADDMNGMLGHGERI